MPFTNRFGPKSPHRRKTILVIVEYFPPRLGGDRRIFELLKRFPREQYEITFLVLPPSYTLFMAAIDKKPPHFEEISVEGIRGLVIGYPKTLLALWRRLFPLSHLATLAFLAPIVILYVLRDCPDLLIVNNTSVYSGILGYVASVVTRTKFLADFNDLESQYTIEKIGSRVPKSFHGAAKLCLGLAEDMILTRSRKITTHTLGLKAYAEKRFRKDVVYIPDGVDTELFSPDAIGQDDVKELRKRLGLEDVFVCTYAGRIDENIGGELLYAILKTLERNQIGVTCIVVGEGSPDLIRRIRMLGTVVWVGFKPPLEVRRYIALADAVLVPYPHTKAANYVSPLKIFEGLALGKPVIASDLLGIRDVVLDHYNGILVDQHPESWVEAIREVARDKSTADDLSRNALATVSKYDWGTLSMRFYGVVESILATGS
jgi:glycosyltransferase involved in cell wall biosynthesis